jgi:hypothetical protein
VVEDHLCGRCGRIRGSSMTYTSTNELPTSSKEYLFASVQMTYLTKRIDISIDNRIIFYIWHPQVQLGPYFLRSFFLKRVVLTYHDVQV